MNFSLNKKGFFFTLSVILFATTLIVFSQSYLDNSNSIETSVNKLPRLIIPQYLNKSISNDLQKIFDIKVDYNFNDNNLDLIFSGALPYQYSVTSKLSDYESLLDNNVFSRFYGANSADFSNISDNTLEIFGSDLNFSLNYNDNNIDFSSEKISDLILTIVSQGDYNAHVWEPATGSTPIRIHYYDLAGESFVINDSINLSNDTNLSINFDTDANIFVDISNNELNLHSNSSNIFDYSLDVTLSNIDTNSYPINFNSVLSHSSEKVDSNSFIKIIK